MPWWGRLAAALVAETAEAAAAHLLSSAMARCCLPLVEAAVGTKHLPSGRGATRRALQLLATRHVTEAQAARTGWVEEEGMELVLGGLEARLVPATTVGLWRFRLLEVAREVCGAVGVEALAEAGAMAVPGAAELAAATAEEAG